jgi:RNA polymerase sigma factor (sigma-70 family)
MNPTSHIRGDIGAASQKICIGRADGGNNLDEGDDPGSAGEDPMASSEATIGRDLRRLFDGGAVAGLSEAQLLDCVARRDESAGAAFEAILTRHGPVVLACCRRVLGDSAAAEDAFQATFLVLYQRAGSIRVEQTLEPWLRHVARLAALKARQGELRRRARECRAARPEGMIPDEEAADLRLLVRAEVDRLPGKYREPVRLCYFEGRTHDDAAAALGWPVGTVRGRLSRAREVLRSRLSRRCVGLSPAALVAAMAAGGEARAEVPRALVETTLAATTRGAAVRVGVAVLATAVARGLAAGAALKAGAVVLAVVALISTGAGLLVQAGRGDGPHPQPGPPPREATARAGAPAVDRYGDPLPRGAIARLGTTRFRHSRMLSRVFFAPDGRTLVTVSSETRVWDVATGRLLRSFDTDGEVVLSSDGRTLFAAGRGPRQEVHSPDGRMQSVLGRGFLKAMDFTTGRELRRIEWDPTGTPNLLVISPDGKHLALWTWFRPPGGRDERGVLTLLDAGTLVERWRIEKKHLFASVLALSGDGRLLAVAGPDEGLRLIGQLEPKSSTIRILDVTSGAELRRIPFEQFGVASLAFTPDGRTLAAGIGDRTIRLYDPATGQERLPRLGREHAVPLPAAVPDELKGFGAERGSDPTKARAASCLAFSPDGSMLASGLQGLGYSGGVYEYPPISLWDVAAGREVRRFGGHKWHNTSLAFSPDGRTLASSGYDAEARIWDVTTGREVDHRPGHPGEIHAVAVSPVDGTVFTSGGADGILLHWNPADGRLLETVGVKPSIVNDLAVSPDGRTLFVPDCGLVLWDLAGRKELRRLDPGQTGPNYFHAAFAPDGGTVRSGKGVWDVATGRLLVTLPSSPDVASLTADGHRIVTVEREGIRIWDVATGAEVRRPVQTELKGWTVAAFSPDGRLVAIGNVAPKTPGQPNKGDRLTEPIQVWELASGRPVASLFGHTDDSCDLAFSSDGRMLASVSGTIYQPADPGLRIWDVATGKPLRRIKFPPMGGRRVAYLPGDRSIVTAGEDGMALVWDVSDLADRRPAEPPDARALGALWSDLASDDAPRAHRASWTLSVDVAVPFLRDRLRPATAADSARVSASRGPITDPETLRSLRAVAALERIGNAQAREALETLARGDSKAPATEDAGAALIRLSHRTSRPPDGATR